MKCMIKKSEKASYQRRKRIFMPKTSVFEVWSERERFWEVKRQDLSREIVEK